MSISVPSFVNPFIEDENTVRNRLLAAYPDGVSQEVGTWARDFGEINVAEFVRQWASIGQMLAQTFVSWATGQQLDAWALSYGITRGAGSPAYATVRFFAPTGTAIPPGAVVEVPQTDPDADRLRYQTNNPVSMLTTAAGYIDVPSQALDVGVEYNVAAGAITLLDSSLPAVTQVQNQLPMVGGEDPEIDDDLRQRVLEQAQLPVGSGTALDYGVWGLEVPGVGDVAVYTQWDTSGLNPGLFDGRQNGSVLMMLRDSNNAPVDYSIVQACQRHVAPSRALLATFEQVGVPPAWSLVTTTGSTTVALDTTNKQMGAGTLQFTFSVGGGTGVAQVPRSVDLSRFAPTDEIIVWVKASDWSKPTSISLQFLQDAADYYSVPWTLIASDGIALAHPTTGAAWWQWRVQFSQFTKTGNPNWAGITALQVSAAAAGTTINFSYMIARYLSGSTGVGGRAPVGADVTAYTAVPLAVNVTITNSLLQDGYTLVDSPGQTNATTLLAAALTAFLAQLRPGLPVRFVDIAQVVHDTPGWIDFTLSLPAAVGTPLAVPVALTQDAVLGTLATS
jgi:uncharacterized phage protein gp47/JayE